MAVLVLRVVILVMVSFQAWDVAFVSSRASLIELLLVNDVERTTRCGELSPVWSTASYSVEPFERICSSVNTAMQVLSVFQHPTNIVSSSETPVLPEMAGIVHCVWIPATVEYLFKYPTNDALVASVEGIGVGVAEIPRWLILFLTRGTTIMAVPSTARVMTMPATKAKPVCNLLLR